MGVLLSLISFPLCGCHVSGRYRQGQTVRLENEEYDDIPSRVSSAHSRVDMLAFPMASLDELKLRIALEDLDHLMLVNVVFPKELIENLFEPDESNDSHTDDSHRSAALAQENPPCRTYVVTTGLPLPGFASTGSGVSVSSRSETFTMLDPRFPPALKRRVVPRNCQ